MLAFSTNWTRLLATLVLLLFGPSQAAEVFRWTDDRGNVHFGDRPPPGRGETVELRPEATTPPPNESGEMPARRAAQRKLLRIYSEERMERAEARRREAALREERQRNCLKARETLERYRHAPSLYRVRDDGTPETLSTAERRRVTEEASEAVERLCR